MALQSVEPFQFSDAEKPSAAAKLRLPHPHLTTYYALSSGKTCEDGTPLLAIHTPDHNDSHAPLHNDNALFTLPKADSPASTLPPPSNNTPWARARRAPLSLFTWTDATAPSLGQLWLAIYFILTIQPDQEIFRLTLRGPDSTALTINLKNSMLGIDHPADSSSSAAPPADLVIHRSAFWQGAGSPFDNRPAWTPTPTPSSVQPVDEIITTLFPDSRVHARHPRRPAKPAPGSIVYSRYIPALDTHFSLQALDWENPTHVELFHTWQNDPRVAAGWNETGTLAEHTAYLRRQHEDAHTLSVLGRFDDTAFSYFEIYWASEDALGAHYDAGTWDRGRHSLVGDARFRGEHRVRGWWPSVVHFCFLDDRRTGAVVGEPRAENARVMRYDYLFGLNVERYVDFPHKRAALVRCSRQRFFQLAPFNVGSGGVVAGIGLPFPSRL